MARSDVHSYLVVWPGPAWESMDGVDLGTLIKNLGPDQDIPDVYRLTSYGEVVRVHPYLIYGSWDAEQYRIVSVMIGSTKIAEYRQDGSV